MPTQRQRGFTLVELVVTAAVVALLAGITLPAYHAHVTLARLPAGMEALSSFALRMEQAFQDSGSYGSAGCRLAPPEAEHFGLRCTLTDGGQGFPATATGTGPLAGYRYAIDHNAQRRTLAHPRGLPSSPCWSLRGRTCDS